MSHIYLIALGSNMRVPGLGQPRTVIEAAYLAMARRGVKLVATSPIISSAPIGPSQRRYANAAAVAETALTPPDLLGELHSLENAFGRRRGQRMGARWRSRVLDLDIVLWSGGIWASPDLIIPHREYRRRDFVLNPAIAIAAGWRDPLTGKTIAQCAARLRKAKRKGV